jgi:hypothetical protein
LVRRFIISMFVLFLLMPLARAADPYLVVSPTGMGGTDTVNLLSALSSCTSTKGIFLGEGTFKIIVGLSMTSSIPCTITGSGTGAPTSSSGGVQNTVIDCSGLSGTASCISIGTNNALTGLSIIGNGNSSGVNTVCIDSQSPAGGNVFEHLVLQNCGWGIAQGSAGCCAQDNWYHDITMKNVGVGYYCHANCTDNQMSDVTIISPTYAGILMQAGSMQFSRIAVTGVPPGQWGLNMGTSSWLSVSDSSVDGGTCIVANSNALSLSSIRCTGDGGANEYCVNLSAFQVYLITANINCTGGYNGSGSSVLSETNGLTGGCQSCFIDISWNGTDPLYNSAQAASDLDWLRYSNGVGYAARALTGTTFAAPDFSKGYNQSFAITSACSTPCAVPAPVYAFDGQGGYFAFTQPTPAVTSPLIWNSFYQNTAQPLATAGKTTWFPWVARDDNAAIILGPSFHN